MRRLEEVPKIHADPKMDPSYESEEEDTEMEDNKQGPICVIMSFPD